MIMCTRAQKCSAKMWGTFEILCQPTNKGLYVIAGRNFWPSGFRVEDDWLVVALHAGNGGHDEECSVHASFSLLFSLLFIPFSYIHGAH